MSARLTAFADFIELVSKSRREAALVGAAALIIVSLTGFSFWLTNRVLKDVATTHELHDFNARLTHFVQLLRTVESSHRGYLITGQPEFLAPYKEYSGRLLQMASQLSADAPKSLALNGRVADLDKPLQAKLEEMTETIALADGGQREAAVGRVKDGLGRMLTEQIEKTAELIQNENNAFIQGNEARTVRLQNLKFFLDGTGAVLVLTLSFLSLWLLLRSNAAIREAQNVLASANADLEKTVEQRTAALTRANEEIQRFAYIVSHDLRSPLVNIMGFTSELETLRKELFEKLAAANALAGSDALSKDFDEAFGFIKTSIARMDRLIAAILRISREGSRPLNPEPIDTKTLVENVVAGVAHQIKEKDANVVIGSLPGIVTDRLALEQIFSNLIENAIKFLKPGGQGEIKVEGFRRGAETVYIVSDNGRGIDPKDHQRIFELFRRSGPQDVPGEGMGLAYVLAQVRRLGGGVTVDSAVGRGSAFKLTLPASASRQGRIAA